MNEFRPEKLIAVYDTRSPSSDSRVVLEIEKYILLLIERLLDHNLGHGDRLLDDYLFRGEIRNDVSERKHSARNSIHDALLDPTSKDGLSLREYFRKTIHNRCVDAGRRQFQYERRFIVLKNFENDFEDDPQGQLDGLPDRYENRLIQYIDLQNITEAEAHAGRRLTIEMTIRGYTQEEIALATGVDVRQVQMRQADAHVRARHFRDAQCTGGGHLQHQRPGRRHTGVFRQRSAR